MKFVKILLLVAVGVVGYLIVQQARQSTPASEEGEHSTVAPAVEQVLRMHQGEETPFVQAFEAALEEERHSEEKLAHEVGVRA